MQSRELTCLPVTDPDGRLFGVVRHKDIEAELASKEVA